MGGDTMKGDFLPSSIAEGFCLSQFVDDWDKIPRSFRRTIKKLFARISEASYRRGFQQGAFMVLEGRHHFNKEWLFRFRFNVSLDKAPDPEFAPKMICGANGLPKTAMERLALEYARSLSELGISIERSNETHA